MKKIFTFLSLVMLFVFATNANARKTWDFTKGVSEESRAALDADAGQWTKTMNSDGTATASWATINAVNGEELKAGGNVIPEFSGLLFGDFAQGNAVLYRGNCVRLQKDCTVTIPSLLKGQTIVVKAQSANASATDRGIGFLNAVDGEGNANFVILGRDAADAPEGGVTTITVNVVDDGNVVISTGKNGAPKSGIEILSIIIDEGDKNIKKWDFSAFSEATATQVCGAEDWTPKESDSKDYLDGGNQIRWINGEAILDANDDLTAGGKAIKELKGLRFTGLAKYNLGLAFDYQNLLDGNQNNGWGPYQGASYMWVMGSATTLIVPKVKAGSTFKIGVESHKYLPAGTSDNRGFQVLVDGVEVGTTQTTGAYQVFEYTIPGEGENYVDVTLKATKGCHLYFIEAEVKESTGEDKNPELGNPKYSIANNSKIPLQSEGFTMTFPGAKNLNFDTEITIDGYLGLAKGGEGEFDGVSGTVGEGLVFTFSDFAELQENTEYTFYVTKLVVDGFEKLNLQGEKLFQLNFTTSGPGIKEAREWNFTLDAADAEAIAQSIDNAKGLWAASSKGRYSVANPINYSPLYTAEGVELSKTAGLYFSMGTANDILVGTPAHTGVGGEANGGGNNGKLQLGGGIPKLIIPQCSAGDEVTITALWSTKNSGIITLTNGTYTAEGAEPVNEFNVTGSAADYKIVVSEDGDLVLGSKNMVYTKISIFPAGMSKEEINYTVNAVDADDNVIAEIMTGKGQTNDKVNVKYSYYMMDKEGNLYTNGARGSEFGTTISLETGKEAYGITYKKASLEGLVKAVFCAEAEELDGVSMSTHNNLGVRASKGKAAFNEVDVTLCTLAPGTYKIKGMVWDSQKGGGTTIVFKAGEAQVELVSTSDNMSEVISMEAITVTEPTQLVWVAGGSSDHCLDAVVVYEFDETLTGAEAVAAEAAEADVVKVVENGQLLIKTAKGVFNAVGAQVK